MAKQRHTAEVRKVHEQILRESPVQARYVEIGGGRRLHVLEAGSGPPLVYLHGGGAAAHTALPFVQHLQGVHVFVPDRPGYGLSDAVDIGPQGYRTMALAVTDQLLDALGLEEITLAGSSGGGVWAMWYALAHAQRVRRLLLLGSAPLLPGTYAPLPLRLSATPVIGDILGLLPSNEKMVVQMMTMVGEGQTIVDYPQLIKALAASNNDPLAARAERTELAALLTLFGFREEMKIRAADLAQLSMPVLVVWGDQDPVGDADVARGVCEAIPDCQLVILPAGHVPYLGHPQKVAQLIMDFVGVG